VTSSIASSDDGYTLTDSKGDPRVPPTGSTFQTGNTEQGLKDIRTRLLDLTNRNKLLNCHFPSASCLRFVDLSIDGAYNRLMDGITLPIQAVPEPPYHRRSEKPTAVAYANELGWRTSYDLEEDDPTARGPVSGEEYEGNLPTLHYADHLNTLARKIDDAARTAIDETGVNMLHLTFGFLEWYESDDSDEAHLAPLVSVPVTLDRDPGKGKSFRCEVEYSGEDFDTNLSLVEKMRRDMGLEIPLLGEDGTPEQYFDRFADLLSTKKRWSIRRQVALSLLDFGRLLMFRDLDPKNWPADANISSHPLVRELFERSEAPTTTRAEEYPIDEPALQSELPALICDADSSQHSALIDAMRGKNLVIEGPPGTGKSQTISNLIAEALAKGRSVLFVSDKLAALQVVRDRLEERGLGAFCLELHSHKTKKGALLKDVERRIDLADSFDDPLELDRLLTVAETRKKRLIEYVSLIREVVFPIQQTVFAILWARESAYQALPFSDSLVSGLAPSSLLEYTRTRLSHAHDWLAIYMKSLADILGDEKNLNQHPWYWLQNNLPYGEEQECTSKLVAIVTKIDAVYGIRTAMHEIPFPVLDDSSTTAVTWTQDTIHFLSELFRVLDATPTGALDSRTASLEDSNSIATLRAAAQEARRLQSQSDQLSANFDLNVGSPAELERHAVAIEQTPWFKRIFSGDYRAAVATYKLASPDRKKVGCDAMASGLRSIASFQSQRLAFRNNPTYREHIGSGFVGLESNWDALVKLGDWYETVNSAFPVTVPIAAAFRAALFTKTPAGIKEMKARLVAQREGRTKTSNLIERISAVKSVLDIYRAASGDFPTDCVLPIYERLNKLIEDALRDVETAYEGTDSTAGPIAKALHVLEKASGHDPSMNALNRILSSETEHHLAVACEYHAGLAELLKEIALLAEALAIMSESELWRKRAMDSLSEWRAAAAKALSALELLQDWIEFTRCRLEGTPHGMASVTAIAENGSVPAEALGAAFQFVFYNTLAKHVLSRNPALWEFSGDTQDKIRQQYARTDREVIVTQRKRAAAQAANRYVDPGTRGAHVGEWTGLALLRKEVSKQKRHIPIRELIRRAGLSLQALKPCFMMGPQSVAKYLAPTTLKFDLVVMDEASQIRPEDAIGALARGQQAVIVGDPMQLPPTSFFNRIAPQDGSDEMDGSTIAADSESILDVASVVYSSRRRLRWHYRSQHESLIAFSNQEFYGDLIVFPHAQRDSETMGIKYRFVPDGVYENRCNPKEALTAVEAVLDHMKTHPNESLGLVTMNFEQKEVVEGLLEDRFRDDPFAQSFCSSMVGTKAFFVKNLENVQGDERDVIFISTTYGPDGSGNQFQRFGPVNSGDGHRRLNVLFTRAKFRTVVFTSLDTDKILISPESSRGLRAFKGYLQFARTGILESTTQKSDLEINDFERSVRAVLEARKYETVPQVGVAGFFIDIAVKHPKKPGAFLLGIECDGATYHSSKSARDRDRLREEILRSRGWNLHRIWSTDWFKNRNREIDKMFRRIEATVNAQAR
jgi:very-short-patch-repair endonuclease